MADISAQQLTLSWSEVTAGSGINQAKPRVGRTNSPAHQLPRQGYRTIGEVCVAAGVLGSTLIGWENRFVQAMKKINGIRVVAADEFDTYVTRCVEIRPVRYRKAL